VVSIATVVAAVNDRARGSSVDRGALAGGEVGAVVEPGGRSGTPDVTDPATDQRASPTLVADLAGEARVRTLLNQGLLVGVLDLLAGVLQRRELGAQRRQSLLVLLLLAL